MHWWQAVAILAAGVAAGAINAIVGSGTLITFPVLLALGYPPVTANISNNIGLVPGGLAGAWGYRRELAGRRALLLRLAPFSAAGAITGALLLLRLPAGAFTAIVPVLIAISLLLVVAQPWLAARVAARRGPAAADGGTGLPAGPLLAALVAGVFLAGAYGGYFGAAQGVLLIGLLGSLLADSLQRVNAQKNLLSALVNGVAAVTFVIASPGSMDWAVVALIAAGSTAGGLLGASVGRRLPAPLLRAVIVLIGLVAIVRLLIA